MGGLAIRRWSPHAHAAYVAHWRQVLTSTQFSLAGIDADFCAFPAVTRVIEVAAGAALLASHGSAATALGDDLGESWRQCVALAQQQVPDSRP